MITMRAKLLNAEWSMKSVLFHNFASEEGKITIGPQVAQQPLMPSRCFSAQMPSRFEIIDEKQYIKELKDKIENENTKNSGTEYWKSVIKKSANNIHKIDCIRFSQRPQPQQELYKFGGNYSNRSVLPI